MLLTTRKFLPYFTAQALGAFNDNLFKQLLVLLFTYQAARFDTQLSLATVTNLASGLFIAPFALFSGLGGHLADHFNKARLIQVLKATELLIMLLAAYGLVQANFWLLMGCVFLIGTQSAFFGPVKYAYLPATLATTEIMAGNALIESVTFIMILLGTLTAGVLVSIKGSTLLLALIPCLVALIGLGVTFWIPGIPTKHPSSFELNNLWRSNVTGFKQARQTRSVWLSILGISWFWFIGAMVLAQLPDLAQHHLRLDSAGLTWLMGLFSVGVGLGSLFSEKLSGKQVEIGLVPLGSAGLSLFLLLAWRHLPDQVLINTPLPFWHNEQAIRFGINLALAGLFGGFYTVPLYALIQTRADKAHVASVIGTNNVLNAIFMVLAAGLGLLCHGLGFQTPALVLFAGLFNLVVAAYIYSLVPEFLWRFIVWALVHTVYRFKVKGLQHIPDTGPCIVVCNHIGFSDAVVLAAAIRRPLRFIMYYKIFQMRALGWFFRTAKAIPIAGRQEDPAVFEAAFRQVKAALDDGEVVCLFPEGKLTSDGEIGEFKPGLLKILEHSPVPVIPMALGGLWGSVFTRKTRFKEKEWGRPIDLQIGPAIDATDVDMEALRDRVIELRTRP
ncbi:MFS transporter [Limnobacter litoralis]|uniref:MFS transporter n=1 Tax=Limnobacter litoralis TaxID=481366 RepID=A0ABQ5YSN0_9BURK|nr:MFS transporter [Limnobacter litoralis]GLR27639.1 MFS transporter [Limnobacter litoralis]